jgi:carbon-monoxide dehydrogenase small subunit
MARHDITLKVNGESHSLTVESNELLLNVLRERLYLTGSKYGCGIAECGACSILVDGLVYLACMVPAAAADGWNITTIEGLAKDGELNHIQQAFLDYSAIQCGFCTPGMVVTSQSLLNENPNPDEVYVRDYLRGNLCRCTGYSAIVDAVLDAAEKQRA